MEITYASIIDFFYKYANHPLVLLRSWLYEGYHRSVYSLWSISLPKLPNPKNQQPLEQYRHICLLLPVFAKQPIVGTTFASRVSILGYGIRAVGADWTY
jgi:hypothetical protein